MYILSEKRSSEKKKFFFVQKNMERSHLDEETIVNHFICHSRPGLGEGLDPTVYFKKYSFSNSQEMENG